MGSFGESSSGIGSVCRELLVSHLIAPLGLQIAWDGANGGRLI